jgi:cytochrome c-type biogenesis protein CcmH/NrfG
VTPRPQLLIGFLCLALTVYFVMLARTGVALLRTGTPAAVALGIGVLLLPIVGAWATVATLRAGLAHQRLARLAAEQGMELDVSALPTRPSGRVQRDAADALFATVRAEVEANPEDWRRWYRLARAHDLAGDRTRAREAMRKAVALQAAEADR